MWLDSQVNNKKIMMMKAILNKNLFKVNKGWVMVEPRPPVNGEYWIYHNTNEPCDGVITEANLPPKWFDRLHDKHAYYTVIVTIDFKLENVPYAELPVVLKEFENYMFIRGLSTAQEYNLILEGWNAHNKEYKFTQQDMIAAYMEGCNDGANTERMRADYSTPEILEEAEKYNDTCFKEFKESITAQFEFETEVVNDYNNYGLGEIYPENKREILLIVPDPNHSAGKAVIKNIK